MANPQPTDAHLRIAHSINEQLMVSHFSEQQRRILDFILRLSWGCGSKVAYIPHQKDFEMVGVREGHVKSHLDWLVEAKVIIRQDRYYQFNKDYDQWRVSRTAGYTKKKLTEIVSLNLNQKKPELTGGDPFPYSGHFYIAKGQNDIYKIGVSKDPETRMNSFLGLPFEVELIWDIYVKDATKIEAQIKRDYNHRHTRGEWYKFTESDISEIRKLTQSVSIDPDYLRKREAQLTEKVSPAYGKGKLSTPKSATPKEILNKVLNKDIYIVLFNLWNDLKIITHKNLTSDMKKAIDSARKDYSQEEIEQAMRNYAFILKGNEYRWTYKWTLAEFLSRRHSNNIERFLDLEVAKSNFRKEANGGAHKRGPGQLKPREQYTNPEEFRRRGRSQPG